jgi:hypothetical protein
MVVTGICLVIGIVYGTLEIYFHKVVDFRQKNRGRYKTYSALLYSYPQLH